jgi:hypothetical protein
MISLDCKQTLFMPSSVCKNFAFLFWLIFMGVFSCDCFIAELSERSHPSSYSPRASCYLVQGARGSYLEIVLLLFWVKKLGIGWATGFGTYLFSSMSWIQHEIGQASMYSHPSWKTWDWSSDMIRCLSTLIRVVKTTRDRSSVYVLWSKLKNLG